MKATATGLHKTFFYLTQRQIYNVLLNLRGETTKAKKRPDLYPVVLTTDALNERPDDKSLWYTFTQPFLKKHADLAYCLEGEATVENSDRYVKAPDREELEGSLLQFCNRVLADSEINQDTLLQFCNRVYALKNSQSETQKQSLLQFCKSYPITKLYMAYYKIVTHIKVIDLDLDLQEDLTITTTTTTTKEDRSDQDQRAVVVAVPEKSSPPKRPSYLGVTTFPDELKNGKLQRRRNYDATSEQDTQHLSRLAETYKLTSPELEKFLWEHSQANPDMQQPWIASLTELEKGLEHAKKHMRQTGSPLGFLRHFYYHGHFVKPSTHIPDKVAKQKPQESLLEGFSPEAIAAARRQTEAARR
jgi:hypothetical protein